MNRCLSAHGTSAGVLRTAAGVVLIAVIRDGDDALSCSKDAAKCNLSGFEELVQTLSGCLLERITYTGSVTDRLT